MPTRSRRSRTACSDQAVDRPALGLLLVGRPRRGPGPAGTPGRRPRRRRGHRRRRLHRALDGVLPGEGRSRDPHRDRRGERGRVRRQRAQRRLVLSAVPRIAGQDRARQLAAGGDRDAARDARHRRRGRTRRRSRGAGRRLGQGRDRGPGPDARPARPCPGGRGPLALLGLRRRGLPPARRRRGERAGGRDLRAGGHLHAALRRDPPGQAGPWAGRAGRGRRGADLRGHAGHQHRAGCGAHSPRRRPRTPRGARHRGVHCAAAQGTGAPSCRCTR